MKLQGFLLIIIAVLLILLVAAMLLILELYKTKNKRDFYFKRGTRLYDLAFKDDLTGVLNRNAYIRDLGKLDEKQTKQIWFLIFDIDDFKTINDTKGHLFGDKVLISAANRLCKIFDKKYHRIYRIGGDEFLIIAKGVSEEDVVNRLLALEEVEVANDDFRFSKGYSLVENMGVKYVNAAFDNADKMLYADKKSKKKQVGFKV